MVHFCGVFSTIRGSVVQLEEVYGKVQGVSSTQPGVFSKFYWVNFKDFFLYSPAVNEVWVQYLELSAPPSQKICMPTCSFACSASRWCIEANFRHGGRRENGRSLN